MENQVPVTSMAGMLFSVISLWILLRLLLFLLYQLQWWNVWLPLCSRQSEELHGKSV